MYKITFKKNKIINMIFGFILGILFASTGVFAATVLSGRLVGYDNSNSKLGATTVQDAIDEVYKMSKTNCPKGYICQKK